MDLRARVGSAIVGQSVVGYVVQVDADAGLSVQSDLDAIANAVLTGSSFFVGKFDVVVELEYAFIVTSSVLAQGTRKRFVTSASSSKGTLISGMPVRRRNVGGTIAASGILSATPRRIRISSADVWSEAVLSGRGGIVIKIKPGPVLLKPTRTRVLILS